MTLYNWTTPWPTPPIKLTTAQYQIQAFCDNCGLGKNTGTLLLAVETKGIVINLTGVPCPACGQALLKKVS